jgi:hypothetical protein
LSTPERSSRFGDWTLLKSLCRGGSSVRAFPFFAGSMANNRMDMVRKAIYDIRANWTNYPEFMCELRQLMADSDQAHLGSDVAERFEALFSSTKNWWSASSDGSADDVNYSAVQLYSSEYGYRKMFSVINTGFRTDELADNKLALRSGTFLVELLTIDLFNYVSKSPYADDFEGYVYRGMCASDRDLAAFDRVMQGPIEERFLSIPLAMTSASTNREQALLFASKLAAREPGHHPLLWNISVSSLEPGLLSVYKQRFPASIVTSLCAVPIDKLSDYPHEKEVVLRGPHFQMLNLRKERMRAVGDVWVIDAVMLNSNRDHISAIASNVGEDRVARDFFRSSVIIHRSVICAQYAMEHGLEADAEAYHALASKNRRILESINAAN